MWLHKLIARLIPPVDASIQPLTGEYAERQYQRERADLECQIEHVFAATEVMRGKATARER
jgi:hypothetical protein